MVVMSHLGAVNDFTCIERGVLLQQSWFYGIWSSMVEYETYCHSESQQIQAAVPSKFLD